MTPGDREALDALSLRLGHVSATAALLAQSVTDNPQADTLWGIQATIDEVAMRLDAITEPTT